MLVVICIQFDERCIANHGFCIQNDDLNTTARPPAQERANWTVETFRNQGIEQDENGELVFDGSWGEEN